MLIISRISLVFFCSLSLVLVPAVSWAADRPGAAEIIHTPDAYYFPGFRIEVQADVQSKSSIKEVRCHFRAKGEKEFAFIEMHPVEKSLYYGTLPAPWVDSKTVEYQFSVRTAENVITRSQVFQIPETATAEAGEWREAGKQVTEEARDQIEDRIRQKLIESYQDRVPGWQQAKPEGNILVRTDAAQAPKSLAGFKDSVAIKGSEAAGGGGAAASSGGGTSTMAIVGGAAAVGIGAVALGGGGGKGGGSGTTMTTTTTTGGGACASQAGNWSGGFSQTADCQGTSGSGSWSMSIKDDCSLTGTWISPAGDVHSGSGSVSGNSVSASVSSDSCGSVSWNGTISGNSVSGSFSFSAGGGGSWSGSKN